MIQGIKSAFSGLFGSGGKLPSGNGKPSYSGILSASERANLSDADRIINKLLRLWQYGNEEYYDFMVRQNTCRRFLNDDQWTSDDMAYFRSQNRAPLTINITAPYSGQVEGMMRGSRSYSIVAPGDDITDEQTAEMAQNLLYHVNHQNRRPNVDNLIFNDGLSGKGNWHVYDTYEYDPLGEVKVERDNPYSVIDDPESLDPQQRDLKWQMRCPYFSAHELVDMYPDKVSQLRFSKEELVEWYEELREMLPMFIGAGSQLVDQQNGLYAVLELHERIWKRTWVMLDKDTGKQLGYWKHDPRHITKYQIATGNIVMPVKKSFMRKTCILPYKNILLRISEQPYYTYPHISYLSQRKGNKIPECSSFNYRTVGLQREVNMRRSNQQEAVIRSLRGGYWVYNVNSNGQTLLHQLNQTGSKIGQSYLVEGGPGTEPKPIMGAEVMQGLHYLEQGAVDYFQLVTGLSVQPFGGETSGESGTHRALRQEETATTLLPVLEDFDDQKTLVDETILERKIAQLSFPMLLRMRGESGDYESIELDMETIQRLKRSRKFDIRVNEGPYAMKRRMDRQEERLYLTEFTSKVYGPGLTDPGDIWEGSGLPDAKSQAEVVRERYMEILRSQRVNMAKEEASAEMDRSTNNNAS